MKHILTAVDGSDPSLRALEFAVDLAKRTAVKLTVLLVREFIVGRRDVAPALSEKEFRALEQKVTAIMAQGSVENAEMLSPKSRDAAYTIVETAIELEADLIVMGASGKGTVKKMILGSVSQEVLRKAPCPVTIVH